MAKNKFCEKEVLRNESDVEHFFIDRLLADLGFKDSNILTKHLIPKYLIGKGKNQREYRPDYALKINKLWVSVIEVKHPELKLEDYVQEAQDYATLINRGYVGSSPIKLCLASNGIKTSLLRVDKNEPVLELDFADFEDNNEKYKKLKELFSYSALRETIRDKEDSVFEFRKPDIDQLKGIFQKCHYLIWKKHNLTPQEAFYRFTKLLFVKINEDAKLHDKLEKNGRIEKEDVYFSVDRINELRAREGNPIDHLFKKYRDELNIKVKRKEKKRIFEENEELGLQTETTIEIAKLLENFDLKSVEDDINGRVFETFLSAVIRGKELGMFFTPRTVVRFMVKLADLKVKYNSDNEEYEPPLILDGCCGSGGFLIFALSDLLKKAESCKTDYENLKKRIKEKSLYGVDKSEDKIIPIARMNMYLHGDGGSHVFMADTLDKDVFIPEGLSQERKEELQELQELFKKTKFQIVITNPPFSMRYKTTDESDERILKQYTLAHPDEDSAKIRSLKSNVMFLERYFDLLEEGGKLITIIDESILNADGQGDEYKRVRTWIRGHFIIKAIISLPKNTFVNADAGVKTSILFLQKRKGADEKQHKVFMAMSENVGHNDAGKETLELNDLGRIYDEYKKFLEEAK
jgi:type I restriction enzyme M protein